MSRKNVNKQVLSPQTLSTGVSVTKPLFIADSAGTSLHILWDGVPEATLTLETSNDPMVDRDLTLSKWATESTVIDAIDGTTISGSTMLHLGNVHSTYVRVSFNVTVAGTFSVYATSKV